MNGSHINQANCILKYVTILVPYFPLYSIQNVSSLTCQKAFMTSSSLPLSLPLTTLALQPLWVSWSLWTACLSNVPPCTAGQEFLITFPRSPCSWRPACDLIPPATSIHTKLDFGPQIGRDGRGWGICLLTGTDEHILQSLSFILGNFLREQ